MPRPELQHLQKKKKKKKLADEEPRILFASISEMQDKQCTRFFSEREPAAAKHLTKFDRKSWRVDSGQWRSQKSGSTLRDFGDADKRPSEVAEGSRREDRKVNQSARSQRRLFGG